MRGAVSVALVYYYYDPDGKTYDRQRSTLIAMTLAVVLISTLFFGAVTKPLLDLLLGPQGEMPSTLASICVAVQALHHMGISKPQAPHNKAKNRLVGIEPGEQASNKA